MHTYINNATLLTMFHSDMFHPSKDHHQGVRYISTARSTTRVTRYHVAACNILHAAYLAEFYIWQFILFILLLTYISRTP
jgi:hypothetical protein